jgi:hypothetical protein
MTPEHRSTPDPLQHPTPGGTVPDRLLPLVLLIALQTRVTGRDRERGDVPGWVLITLMTAGIVTVLWSFAGPRMLEILTDALDAVAPGGG